MNGESSDDSNRSTSWWIKRPVANLFAFGITRSTYSTSGRDSDSPAELFEERVREPVTPPTQTVTIEAVVPDIPEDRGVEGSSPTKNTSEKRFTFKRLVFIYLYFVFTIIYIYKIQLAIIRV